MIDAPPEEVKRYKAFLTRLSKAKACEEAGDSGSAVGAKALRQSLVAAGELESYLDEGWVKRVFSDKDLFEDAGDGFWKVKALRPDERPAEPTPWEGMRPGEDIAGNAVRRATDAVVRVPQPPWKSKWLTGDAWEQVHRAMLPALSYAKSRGMEKPLTPLQEWSFLESLRSDDPTLQTVALWLLNTRVLLDLFTRMQASLKGGPSVSQYELTIYGPDSWTGETPPPVSFEATFKNVRSFLLERGILHGKKQ